jgi:hypothetical protein
MLSLLGSSTSCFFFSFNPSEDNGSFFRYLPPPADQVQAVLNGTLDKFSNVEKRVAASQVESKPDKDIDATPSSKAPNAELSSSKDKLLDSASKSGTPKTRRGRRKGSEDFESSHNDEIGTLNEIYFILSLNETV